VVLIRITRGYLGSDRHEPDSRNRGGAVRRAYTYCGQHPASDSACCAFLWCPLRARRSRLCIRRLRWRWRAGSSPSCAVVRAPGRDDLAGVWQPGMDRPESAAGPVVCALCGARTAGRVISRRRRAALFRGPHVSCGFHCGRSGGRRARHIRWLGYLLEEAVRPCAPPGSGAVAEGGRDPRLARPLVCGDVDDATFFRAWHDVRRQRHDAPVVDEAGLADKVPESQVVDRLLACVVHAGGDLRGGRGRTSG